MLRVGSDEAGDTTVRWWWRRIENDASDIREAGECGVLEMVGIEKKERITFSWFFFEVGLLLVSSRFFVSLLLAYYYPFSILRLN